MELFTSFRPILVGKTANFAALFGKAQPEVAEILVEVAVRVSNAKEEGVSFAPAVFIGRDLKEILAVVQGSKPIPIGSGPLDVATARGGLRGCMALGEGRQWAIYFTVSTKSENGGSEEVAELQYGLFCTQRSPLEPTSFESLRLHYDVTKPVIGITRLGDSVVEVRGGGEMQYLDFSGLVDLSHNPLSVVTTFVSNLTHGVSLERRRKFEAYYYRVAMEISNSTHGALVAVVKDRDAAFEMLADGIWLEFPIDIGAQIESYEVSKAEEDLLGLIAYGSLIRKMVAMDGITVLTNDGNLVAYNCFIREQLEGPPSRSVLGGARRRAFDILCTHLGDELSCVLYRSQDGAVECCDETTEC